MTLSPDKAEQEYFTSFTLETNKQAQFIYYGAKTHLITHYGIAIGALERLLSFMVDCASRRVSAESFMLSKAVDVFVESASAELTTTVSECVLAEYLHCTETLSNLTRILQGSSHGHSAQYKYHSFSANEQIVLCKQSS